MTKTIRSIILTSLNYEGKYEWTSPGDLFREAQERGYNGSQERLLQRASELAKQGILEARKRGRMQNNWYRHAPHVDIFQETARYLKESPKNTPGRLLKHPLLGNKIGEGFRVYGAGGCTIIRVLR